MKKIILSQLLSSDNYTAPEFSQEKKAQILAKTIHKKISFLSIKKKYFIEIALSLVLVFVIGLNLDYIKNVGKPVSLQYQDILDAELGGHHTGYDEAMPASQDIKDQNSKDQDIKDQSMENTRGDSLEDSQEQSVGDTSRLKHLEEKVNDSKSLQDHSVVLESSDSRDLGLGGGNPEQQVGESREENKSLAYEIINQQGSSSDGETRSNDVVASEVWGDKYVVDTTKGDFVEKQGTEDTSDDVTAMLEAEINSRGQERNETTNKEKISVPVIDEKTSIQNETAVLRDTSSAMNLETSTSLGQKKTVEISGDTKSFGLGFVETPKIVVKQDTASISFSFNVDKNKFSDIQNIQMVCNVYLTGNFVDSFVFSHRFVHPENIGTYHVFVDLGGSYASYVLHSYNNEHFSHKGSGIRCALPAKYAIDPVWVELVYDY